MGSSLENRIARTGRIWGWELRPHLQAGCSSWLMVFGKYEYFPAKVASLILKVSFKINQPFTLLLCCSVYGQTRRWFFGPFSTIYYWWRSAWLKQLEWLVAKNARHTTKHKKNYVWQRGCQESQHNINGFLPHGKGGARSRNTKWITCISMAERVTEVSIQNELHALVWQRGWQESTQNEWHASVWQRWWQEFQHKMNGMHQYGREWQESQHKNEWYAPVWQRGW